MPTRILCPNCETALQFDEKKVTTPSIRLRCFKCSHVFSVDIANLKQKQNLQEEEKTFLENTSSLSPKKEDTEQIRLFGWLIVHDENTHTQSYSLNLGKNTIGRKSASVEVDIPIETQDKYMSRNHCLIEVIENKRGGYDYILANTENKNGIYVNADRAKKLKEGALIYLEDGATIQIGRTKVVLKTPNFVANKSAAQKSVEEMDYNQTIID